MSHRILVVDDEKNIRSMVDMVLKAEGFIVDLAEDIESAENSLAEVVPDAILLDVRLPKTSGLAALKTWLIQYPDVPIVLMSGEASVSEALQGLTVGAYDFLEKPFRSEKLTSTLKRAIKDANLKSLVGDRKPDAIIGKSDALKEVLNQVSRVAPSQARVLILGESGTGKDLIARAIHDQSKRRTARFVKVNCAAIAKDLIESELFGHVKGAFTGADTARKGWFEVADGGTLFLDEIGELSLDAQAKMLRVLQNGEITPVGSSRVVNVDVRVVAATNRDLKESVQTGLFREDLFYRIAVIAIENPPLRARSEDIPLLANFFLEQICVANGLSTKDIEPRVLHLLQDYQWPGNVRELRNVIERLVILSGPVIGSEHLPGEIRDGSSGSSGLAGTTAIGVFEPLTWDVFKKQSEAGYLVKVLRHVNGNISEAARVLGVERTTIHKWLRNYDIRKHQYI